MRLLILSMLVLGAAATALTARDGAEDRRSSRRATESDRRERLKQNIAAFRRLSPETQEKMRQLDRQLQNEDAATRERLLGLMEHYALWLARLPDTERQRIHAAPAGPDRMRVVNNILERQWIENLPPSRRDHLASLSESDRTKTINRWREGELTRERERSDALRTAEVMAIPGQAERIRQLRDEIAKFIKSDLEPKLNLREKNRLQNVSGKGVTYPYLHQVLILSEAKGLKPPGPPEFWKAYREPRRPARIVNP